MTDRTAADRATTDQTTDIGDEKTVHISRAQIAGVTERDDPPRAPDAPEPGPATEAGEHSGAQDSTRDRPPTRRDDVTVDLTKRDLAAARAEIGVPAPRAPGSIGPPPLFPGPPPPGPLGAGPGPGPAGPPPGMGPGGPPYGPGPGSWPPPMHPQQPPPSWPATYAVPEPHDPPLPPPRGRANTGLIVFGVLAALVITGGVWALFMLAGGNSPFGSRDADPRAGAPSATEAPAPPIVPLPPTAPPTDDPGDSPGTGPTGQVQFSWTLDGTTYQATLTTTGDSGTADVSYPDASGATAEVRQDVRFVESEGRLAYVGSNPRDPVTGAPSTTYLADIFVLATNEAGNVYIEQVCDLSGRCAPATMG